MKTFIFHTVIGRAGKITATIFSVKKNIPREISQTEYYTASYKGHETEVLKRLREEGFISSKIEGYYYHDFPEKHNINIFHLY